MCGGVLPYAAQARPMIDAARAEKNRFRMETSIAYFRERSWDPLQDRRFGTAPFSSLSAGRTQRNGKQHSSQLCHNCCFRPDDDTDAATPVPGTRAQFGSAPFVPFSDNIPAPDRPTPFSVGIALTFLSQVSWGCHNARCSSSPACPGVTMPSWSRRAAAASSPVQ